ncbi:MAG: very short patch repair endonuclease [Candidatus Dadabacteria bacterium]|nr:very short patch repair endonuclease [Candidatus Dadabacteria bacterium]MDE0662385.1 very short patch repair endonuclease [Candidatus Dadabacteria bacterium]
MADTVDAFTRSRIMSSVRGKNTKPEMMIRKALHARGFRYRLHSPGICGKPDLVLSRYRAAIFVHGCFWHGHDCHLFKIPSTRSEFWRAKINRNRQRDAEVRTSVLENGWRYLIVWECALRGKKRLDFETLMDRISAWIAGNDPEDQITGERNP